ncbi:MAG TPA: DinB family protein [Bryobacteraceae bacterium]|nr:DinB family protein [Bryobacteraceae bacterium]
MIPLSERLKEVVESAAHNFAGYENASAAKNLQAGGWSRKQILGHLIDSASNNHQRFVRALLLDELTWPNYDQEGCVRAQRYQEAEWADLVRLWTSYNRFLAHVLAGVPAAKLSTKCRIGDDPPLTLEELAVDYLRHMEHHLEQIRSGT